MRLADLKAISFYEVIKVPVFYMLVILAACAFWLLCSFVYNPLGGFVKQLWQDAEDAMDKDTKDK